LPIGNLNLHTPVPSQYTTVKQKKQPFFQKKINFFSLRQKALGISNEALVKGDENTLAICTKEKLLLLSVCIKRENKKMQKNHAPPAKKARSDF